MIRKTMTAFAGALAVATAVSAAHHELTPAEAKAREIYETVIAMRTAKGHGKVPEMAAYLADELKGAGFADEDIEIFPSGETAAMAVRYRGDGSSGAKPILFLAHMDVVDAKREDWEHDPFTLREEDGYFIGRGVADNKYGVVNLTQTFMRLKQEGFTPTREPIPRRRRPGRWGRRPPAHPARVSAPGPFPCLRPEPAVCGTSCATR